MGINEDQERFKAVGEERREDLSKYIKKGDLTQGNNDQIKVPIKIIDLPAFEYNQLDMGGVGQGGDGEPQPGDPVDDGDQPGDGDDPGDGEGEHDYYDMDPEEFAEELDDELGLDLDPKGKQVAEEKEGPMTDMARSGPESTLDFERMWKKGVKRKMAMHFDKDYLRKVLKVADIGPERAYQWACGENIPVSKGWLQTEYRKLSDVEKHKYPSIDAIPGEPDKTPTRRDMKQGVPLRSEDKRHKYPEIIKEYEKNVVVVNIRDVSGSMRKAKRELVERTFTPMDWYLTGKYDKAEFIYIVHDSTAWQVERDEFFGISSGGGTQISSAYELAKEILESEYPFSQWNRYVFCAGDGENRRMDTEKNVVPLIEDIPANLHAYVETTPNSSLGAEHGDALVDHFGTDHDNVVITKVEKSKDVLDAIEKILSREDD